MTVVNVNDAPVFKQDSYGFELEENRNGSEEPVALGAVTAIDPDAGDTVGYAIAAGDTGLFAIDAASGALSYIGPGEDYESEPNRYDLTVTATDRGGLSATASVTVKILDLNEAPMFKQDSYSFELAENRNGSEEPVALGAVTAIDPDAGDTVGYAIAAGDTGLFAIDAASGALSYIGPGEDYESEPNRYDLTVTATDRGGLSATASVTVKILDLNEAPMFKQDSYSFELAENRIGPVALGAVTAIDPDAGDTVGYAIAAGDTGLFAIDAASGALSYIGPGEDYESEPNRYDLTVTATDRGGLSATASVTVKILDLNEAPMFKQDSYSFELAENRIGPVELGAVSATDPDAGDTVGYAIAAGDTGLFAINAASGDLSYIGPGEDYESESNVYELTVSATDGEGLSAEAGVTVTVIDEEDAIARTRLRRINEAILPELSRAMVSGAVKEVARRIEEEDPHAPVRREDYTVAGYSDIGEVLIANEEALNEGTMDWKRALAGSSFALGLGGGDAPSGKVMFWGKGDWREIAVGGETDPVEFEGDVMGARLGLDARLSDNLLAGVALSWTRSAFDYTDRGEAGYLPVKGVHETRMTSVYPYVGWWPGKNVGLWGTVAYGAGEVQIEDDEAGVQSSDGALTAAALGGHVRLFSDDDLILGGTTALTLKGEAWAARFDLEDNGGLMRALEVDVHRLRLGLEGEYSRRLGDGATLTPSLELGLRYDGGDGETGREVELGGGLAWTDPARGLSVDVHWRTSLAYRGDIKEWGVGGLVTFGPGADDRGLSFSLAPSWGEAQGGLARLWEDELVVANDNDPLAGDAETAMRLDAEIGYGLSAVGGHGVLTPYGGLALSGDGARTWRLGQRLEIGPGFHLSLEWERQETDAGAAEHAVMLKLRLGL